MSTFEGMKSRLSLYWLAVPIPFLFLFWYFYTQHNEAPLRHLPYYGPKHANTGQDTTYHRIKSFQLVNQFGEPYTLDSLKGKIVVCEFFFTTCQSICPIMNNNLQKVYKAYDNRKDVLLLSHTVDPEQDSVLVLRDYALQKGVKDRRWIFLTGSKQQLYQAARKSYLLNADEGDGGEEDFIHTQNFALVDKNQCIRGYYDGTDSVEINRLMTDLNLLIQEHDYEKNTQP